MIIKNHIVYPLLTDTKYIWDWMEHSLPYLKDVPDNYSYENDEKVMSTYRLFGPEHNTLYWVTNTVIDKLEMLKVKKKFTEGVGEHYNWTVFNHLPNNKKTFILPDNDGWQHCLRVLKAGNVIQFLHLGRTKDKDPNSKFDYTEHSVIFYVDTATGYQCDHFGHKDVKRVEDFIYRLLCFVYLSENTEEILKPGEKKGTRKEGKIINTFTNIPVTIINSKWHVTSIRSEGFGVSGHFRILEKNRTQPKMVWVDPYEKKGYVRKAKTESI